MKIIRLTPDWICLLLLVACIVLAGCGSGLKTVPVSGRVTFGGKPPPHSCIVTFQPASVILTGGKGTGAVPEVAAGIGECDASGAFTAVCLRERRGLIPGRYEVVVSCYVPNYTSDAPPVSVIPKDFKPPELVVPADAQSVRYDVDVSPAARR